MSESERFDEVHVVSDLHLGGVAPRDGKGDRRIFNMETAGRALAGWIEQLAETPTQRRVAFVINGDFVDFIAAEDAKYLDVGEATAVRKLDDAIGDCKPLFAAMRKFASRENGLLVILLGNHDVEVMLPPVRERLLQEICADDAARKRVFLGSDGAGFGCVVVDQRVHVTHGNESDSWNEIDAAKVQTLIREMDARRDVTTWAAKNWDPNPGTRLVVELLNELKKSKPWVDLLKPEGPLLVKLLAVTEPDELTARRLGTFAKNYLDTLPAHLFRGLLGEDDARAPSELTPEEALKILLAEPVTGSQEAEAEELLLRADRYFHAGRDPMELLQGGARTLGFFSSLRERFTDRVAIPRFREALKGWIKGDSSFDVTAPDDVFRWFEQYRRGRWPEVDTLIVGHTHLARAIRAGDGQMYYNTGTWIRLMRVDNTVLQRDDRAEAFYRAIQGATEYKQLEDEGFILERTTVARVREEDGRAVGELGEVVRDDAGGPWRFEAWKGSRFVKGGR